jgi:hypothetical protein
VAALLRAIDGYRGSNVARYALQLALEPLDLMARLAALVPTPRMHLTRYHGVFAPHVSIGRR